MYFVRVYQPGKRFCGFNVVFNKSEDAAVRWVVDFAQSNNSQIHTMLGFAIRYSTTHVENCDAVT